MSYSIMFKTSDSGKEYCAVSGIETLHDAHKLKTYIENIKYSGTNIYWVKSESEDFAKSVCDHLNNGSF